MSASLSDNTKPSPARLDAAFFERLFEGAGLAIFACDAVGRVQAWNSRAERLCRGRCACHVGIDFRELLPTCDRSLADEALADVARRIEPGQFRVRIGPDGGSPREYVVWLTPLLDEDARFAGVTVWLHDVTEQVESRRADRKAERLSALGEMSGSVAHHYNNLLCSVATSIDRAQNMSTLAATHKSLDRAAEAVNRAVTLTRQLLAFAQGEYRSCDLSDLTEMVLYFVDENEASWRERGVDSQLDWTPVPFVQLPRESFNVVLRNLVSNALDVMPQGGRLLIELLPDGPDHVLLAVTDTGPGIAADQMERLFEPFFTTKGELGTGPSQRAGMGLAVVHGLVSEMGGQVAARNVNGSGARIEMRLPIAPTQG
ncbi:MAG: two-component system sensor histidine kinase NtrB [Phycisphaerae bacterium]